MPKQFTARAHHRNSIIGICGKRETETNTEIQRDKYRQRETRTDRHTDGWKDGQGAAERAKDSVPGRMNGAALGEKEGARGECIVKY